MAAIRSAINERRSPCPVRAGRASGCAMESFAFRNAPGPCSNERVLSSCASSIPATLRIAAKTCGSSECHSTETNARRQKHDDARRDALGRRALQQRRLSRSRTRTLARATARTARRRALIQIPQPTDEQRTIERRSCRFSIRCRVGKSHNRETFCGCSSAVVSGVWKPDCPIETKIRASLTRV